MEQNMQNMKRDCKKQRQKRAGPSEEERPCLY